MIRLLLDDSVCPVKLGRRNRQADLLGGLQVDHQLELHRLLHGKIGRLSPVQDLVNIASGVSPFGNVTLNPVSNSNQNPIADLAVKDRLPTICAREDYVDNGCMMSYGEKEKLFPSQRYATKGTLR